MEALSTLNPTIKIITNKNHKNLINQRRAAGIISGAGAIPGASKSSLHNTKPFVHAAPPLPRHSTQFSGVGAGDTPIHRSAATGYAAALVDAARCDGALRAVAGDVSRLLYGIRPLMCSTAVGDDKKAAVAKGVADSGEFHRNLAALVRMLAERKKVGMVVEVLEEFKRIYDELSGTATIVVAAKDRMEEMELRRIASDVGKARGVASVKVRHLFAVK